MPSNKKIRIFAGPNGSGKSTLFKKFSQNYNTGFFINADEFEQQLKKSGLIDLKSIGLTATQKDLDQFIQLTSSQTLITKAVNEGHKIDIFLKENFIVDVAKDTHSYEGSLIAAFIRHLMIQQQKSFSFETVMSHPSKINEIKSNISKGYKAYLYFVCTDSPDVNVSRVSNRVKQGGHDVSVDKIVQRYSRTLALLHEILPLCYRAYLFDNSGNKKLELIAELYDGNMQIKTDSLPKWFMDYVLPYYTV